MDFLGDFITSPSSLYIVDKILGSGTFGEVTQCRKMGTGETVALKIIKNHIVVGLHEEMILKKLKNHSGDRFNIVRWNSSFSYKGCFCLEFEKLDMNLEEFMQMCPAKCLELKMMRPILQQLATALQFLKSHRIAHADLKPQNIMVVDHRCQPVRVKVIDFGLALPVSHIWAGKKVQTLWYRSPEVLLGVPFNEAIDVWSLGCIAAKMFMGKALFPGSNVYDMLRHILNSVGKPPNHLLNSGVHTQLFFRPRYSAKKGSTAWRFKSIHEVGHCFCNPYTIHRLTDLLAHKTIYHLSKEHAKADRCDQLSFLHLLVKMLNVDLSERITPSQILQHPFITMSHLVSHHANSPLVKSSLDLMNSLTSEHLVGSSMKMCLNKETSIGAAASLAFKVSK